MAARDDDRRDFELDVQPLTGDGGWTRIEGEDLDVYDASKKKKKAPARKPAKKPAKRTSPKRPARPKKPGKPKEPEVEGQEFEPDGPATMYSPGILNCVRGQAR